MQILQTILQEDQEEYSDVEYSEEYPYLIVEFIKRGRPGIREIDIVPTKWLIFDVKLQKLKVYYKSPPYSEDDFSLIQALAENKSDPPKYWKLFTVRVVGRASK